MGRAHVVHYQPRPEGGAWAVCGAHESPSRRAALSRCGQFGVRTLPTSCLPENATCRHCLRFIAKHGTEAVPWMVRRG